MGNIENVSDRFEFGGSEIVERETDKAKLIALDNGEEEFFPKSQLEWAGHNTWSIPHWLAEDRGMK